METLKHLSQDRELARLAEQREAEIRFYQMDLARERRDGKAEGKAELVAALLEAKFGAVNAATTDRILKASGAELETWALRVLSAPTLADVFAD